MTKPLLFALCLLLAGCPASDQRATSDGAAPAKVADATPRAEPAPAPAPSDPVAGPAAPAPTPAAPNPIDGEPDAARRPPEDLLTQDGVHYGCRTDADCAVKDVGNCCGYYPACVNKDSPTFPDKVKAACSAEGISSICGFPEIGGCQCVEGRCAALSGPGASPQQE